MAPPAYRPDWRRMPHLGFGDSQSRDILELAIYHLCSAQSDTGLAAAVYIRCWQRELYFPETGPEHRRAHDRCG